MKHIQKYITVPLLVFFLMLLHVPLAFAGEDYKQFSLGADSLGMAPSDAKSPDPGVVTAKYGFKIAKDFMPYMGTGLAYTYQPDSKTGDITKIRTGVAAQFGFKYLLGTNSTLKLDYKYLSVSPDLPRGDSRTPPQSLGIGFDIKF
ncbi:MAG: outer membrane beta-barrel protein [Geobacteraceae bacterium]|nr:outer membrane beta-barrel protein [Geobacteraceae bacterium]NTW79472.1 outer membrane beta-barrel protein [Geobacteraceae bacterium]